MHTTFEQYFNAGNVYSHIPVLTGQIISFFDPKPGKIFIDCTLGLGGHTEALLKKLEGKGMVYGIEVDERNLLIAKERLKIYQNVHLIRDNFENLQLHGEVILKKNRRIDGILFDLGISSLHIEEASRGFSFQREGPLDMRYDTREKLTAGDIINTSSFQALLFIFKIYGEEKFSQRIASEIIRYRRKKRFTTTTELADFIAKILPFKGYHRIHPATRIFQALRIATNREIETLEKAIHGAIKILSPQGRIIIVSYHSLEDRLVKNLFRDHKKLGILKILTKKPVIPDECEKALNRKSRSAKLRAAEKI